MQLNVFHKYIAKSQCNAARISTIFGASATETHIKATTCADRCCGHREPFHEAEHFTNALITRTSLENIT